MLRTKKAQRAAILQEGLCVAILRGFRNQLLADRRIRKGEVGVMHSDDGVMLDGADGIELCLVRQRPSSGPRSNGLTATSDNDDQWALRFRV